MHENDIPSCACQLLHADINAVDVLAVGHKATNTIFVEGSFRPQPAKPGVGARKGISYHGGMSIVRETLSHEMLD